SRATDYIPWFYVLLNSTVLFAGSPGGGFPAQKFTLYNVDTDTWTPPRDMLASHSYPNIVSLRDGRALVIGRGDVGEAYDPTTDSWSLIAPLSRPRSDASAITLLDGTVLVSGGWWPGEGALDSAELYNPGLDQWTPVGSMATPRSGHRSVLLQDGRVLVV